MIRTLMLTAVLTATMMLASTAQAGWGRAPHYRNVSQHPHATTHDYYTARYVSPYHNHRNYRGFGFGGYGYGTGFGPDFRVGN